MLKGKIKDRGSEWRAFDQEGREEKSRAGPPSTETIHDKGLSTQIDYRNRDAKGNKLPPGRRKKVYRLRKWHKRVRISDSTDRNLAFALSEMNRMASQLELSRSVQETASKIYWQAVKGGLIRGRSIEGVISVIKRSTKGKRIIICEDSIVRGNQLLRLRNALKEKGEAKQCHARVGCPPLRSPCPYTQTTKKYSDLIYNQCEGDISSVSGRLNLDSLEYNSVENLVNAIGLPGEKLCLACFTDVFPIQLFNINPIRI